MLLEVAWGCGLVAHEFGVPVQTLVWQLLRTVSVLYTLIRLIVMATIVCNDKFQFISGRNTTTTNAFE